MTLKHLILFGSLAFVIGSASAGCGGSLNSSEGTFTSPRYPRNYPDNANCIWFITVHPGSVIRLAFSSFHLESQTPCTFDSVTVYEEFTRITELGKFCGTTDPGVIMSVDNTMMVVFRSDSEETRGGFVANYVSTVCGGSLNSSEGTFTSPEHPQNYPNNANCTWFITVHPGSVIHLAFSSVHLEIVPDCRFDSITVYEEFTGITELGKFCGTTDPGVITSADNTMMVVFRSDSEETRGGFVANYVSTDCEVTYSRCSKTCGIGTRSLITDCPDGDPSPTEDTCCECPCPPKLPNTVGGTGENVNPGGDRKLCRDYSPYKEALACPAPTA